MIDRLRTGCWAVVLASAVSPARAQTSTASEPTAGPASGVSWQPDKRVSLEPSQRLYWRFPRVRPVEYGFMLGLPIVFRIIDQNSSEPTTPRWKGGNFFDDAFQSLLGKRSNGTRRVASLLSDIGWYGLMVYPLVDTLAVALLLDMNPDVAWQMTALNVGAMAVNGFVTLLSIRGVARTRPRTDMCLGDGTPLEKCNADLRGFPSGHVSGAFTGAGLACAHHLSLPLYGHPAADAAACGGALTLATATALMRVVADKHYMLDVVVGAGIGFASGWLLPWLLHYRLAPEARAAQARGRDATAAGLVPFTDARSLLGLAAVGMW